MTAEEIQAAASTEAGDYFDSSEFEIRSRFEQRHFWHAHRREVLASELHAYLGREAAQVPLVEYGCGIGTVSTHLNQSGLHVDYSDIFPNALELAQQRARERLGEEVASQRRFEPRDITQPMEPSGHRGALLLDVIEHLPDDVGALKNVRGSLSDEPSSFVLVTVPAFNFLWSPWDDIEKHKRRYTRASLRAAVEAAGFRVERLTFFFAPLFPAALMVKGLRFLRSTLERGDGDVALDEMAEAKDLGPINGLVKTVLGLEKPIVRGGLAPLGTSLLCIAKKG